MVFENKEKEEKLQRNYQGDSFTKILVKDIIICMLITWGIFSIISPTLVQQNSMVPTCQPDDYILLYKQAYLLNEPKRGDVIVFKTQMQNDNGITKKLLIKRIIAIPGDHIKIEDGAVYINNKQLNEDYINCDSTAGNVDETIPKNHYFVMGDNRTVSIDSRSQEVGLVQKKDICGKAYVRVFPINNAGKIK